MSLEDNKLYSWTPPPKNQLYMNRLFQKYFNVILLFIKKGCYFSQQASELQLKTYVENGLLIMYDQLLEYMKGYRDHQFKFFIHFLDLLVSIFKCYHLSVG